MQEIGRIKSISWRVFRLLRIQMNRKRGREERGFWSFSVGWLGDAIHMGRLWESWSGVRFWAQQWSDYVWADGRNLSGPVLTWLEFWNWSSGKIFELEKVWSVEFWVKLWDMIQYTRGKHSLPFFKNSCFSTCL